MKTSFLGKYEVYTKDFQKYPIQWQNIFENNHSITVEIGFGRGEFLIESAKRNIDTNFIGIETSLTSCYKIQKKIFENNLSNIRIIHEDAGFALREFFSDNSIEKIIFNFPCPWPKKRHSKRRLFDDNFVETLAHVLTFNGKIFLKSDFLPYIEEVRERLLNNASFHIDPIVKDYDSHIKTKYELKWKELGRKTYLLVAKKAKTSDKSLKRFLEGEFALPHRKVSDILQIKLTSLKGFQFTKGEIFFVIKDVYCNINKNEYMLKIHSSDAGFNQFFFVVVTKNDENWLIKLDDATKAYRTPSVKEAVNIIAQELEKV